MVVPVKPSPPAKKDSVPLLRDGQRLDAKEFHRRYVAMPDVRAELIEGVVYMSSPISLEHGTPHGLMIGVLFSYRMATKGVEIADNTSLRPDERNENQPDAMLFILPEHGGGLRRGLPLEGKPELIAEICYTTKKNDLNKKFHVYAKSGVQEYLVWRVEDDEIDWFQLVEGGYQKMTKDPQGIIRSRVFPGLWLPIEELGRQEMSKVMSVLQQGLQSPEHAEFVERLADAKTDDSPPS